MNARKAAAQAHTDQVLAAARTAREKGGVTVSATLPVAVGLADALAAEFEGHEEIAARVIASAASMIGGLAQQLAAGSARPAVVIPTMVNVMALAADSLGARGRSGSAEAGR